MMVYLADTLVDWRAIALGCVFILYTVRLLVDLQDQKQRRARLGLPPPQVSGWLPLSKLDGASDYEVHMLICSRC